MKSLCFLPLALATILVSAQQPVGIFENTLDVGAVLHPGSTQYDAHTQTYRLSGAGENIWFAKDEFHYAYRQVTGNYILQARVKLLVSGGDPHRKTGWMVRTGLASDDPMVSATVHGDGLTAIQYRKRKGADIEEVKSPIKMPDVIQLERRGRSFFLSVAQYGKTFWTVEVPDFDFPAEMYAGLFVCAHNTDAVESASFDNVQIVLPAKDDFRPYREYIGSHLELMEVATGHREIIYSVPGSIQAPNWTPDGKTLIYNSSQGFIYRFDLAGRKAGILPTEPVVRNNNDHVLSFDGRMLGLSSSSGEPEYGSLIYTVPIEGGSPKRITPTGPSYLHGWPPDGRWLTFTGGRNGQYDIYKIPSKGGKEIRLTTHEALDDGPEYSPDGKYIYFNSTRTGSMELWRMRTNGKEQTQLTDDEYQNWFPHLSPDGKWIAFLSYQPEVPSNEHPFYKHVYIRLMPALGGKPRVVSYLYGGQGSMNTPFWSPDRQ